VHRTLQERFLSKLLVGWQGVAALAAEHERVVVGARKRAARRTNSEVCVCVCARVYLCLHVVLHMYKGMLMCFVVRVLSF